MTGPKRQPVLRPVALLMMAAAVVLASCSGGEPSAAPSHARSPATSPPASTTGAEPSGSQSVKPPDKPPKRPPPKTKPRPFRLRLDGVRSTLTNRKMRVQKAGRVARRAAAAIRQRFEGLFKATYIDPGAWRKAKYGPAIGKYFGGQVRGNARDHLSKLTLGPFAGNEFERVREAAGRMRINVLIGKGGGPVTAFVDATFQEKAVRSNGTVTVVVSDGTYFVAPSKHGWVIQAFTVGRHDHRL